MDQNSVPSRYLKEYRCSKCGKLLCKGYLHDAQSVLEVKCRGCGVISAFQGADAQNVKMRSVLINQGAIPDPEKDR